MINEWPIIPPPIGVKVSADINFICNEINFINITIAIYRYPDGNHNVINYDDGNNTITVYDSFAGDWISQVYRTVTFLEPPAGTLLTWLQQNAIKQ